MTCLATSAGMDIVICSQLQRIPDRDYVEGPICSSEVESHASHGECVTHERRPDAPPTPEVQSEEKEQPPTPTSNLKVLASAASNPDIIVREQFALTRKTLNFDDNDDDRQDDDKPAGSAGRKLKSLGLLCTKFLANYDVPEMAGSEICLDEIAQTLRVERRRVYDIINVLESLEIVVRIAKNRYRWNGRSHLEPTLAKLKRLAGPAMFDQENTSNRDVGGARQREKSLGILSQKFIMMFLVAENKTVCLDDAARVLIGTQEQDSAKCKTKVRRLYDIANILTSLQLVKKVQVELPSPHGKKPAFEWIGPNVEEAQKRYTVFNMGCGGSHSNVANVLSSARTPEHSSAPAPKRRRFGSKHSLLDNMKAIQNPGSEGVLQRSLTESTLDTSTSGAMAAAVSGLVCLGRRRMQSCDDIPVARMLPALPKQTQVTPSTPARTSSIIASLANVVDAEPTLDSSMLSPPSSPWPGQTSTPTTTACESHFGLGMFSPSVIMATSNTTPERHHPPPASWVQSTPLSGGLGILSPPLSAPPDAKPKSHLIACIAPCSGDHGSDSSCFDVSSTSVANTSLPSCDNPASPVLRLRPCHGENAGSHQINEGKSAEDLPPHMTVVYELCPQSEGSPVSVQSPRSSSTVLVRQQHLQDFLAAKNLSPSKVSGDPYFVVQANLPPADKNLSTSLLESAAPAPSVSESQHAATTEWPPRAQ